MNKHSTYDDRNLPTESSVSRDELTHLAGNEAVSIVMGLQLMAASATNLPSQQAEALQLLEDSASRLVSLIDELNELSSRSSERSSSGV